MVTNFLLILILLNCIFPGKKRHTYKVTNEGVYIGVNTVNGVNTAMIRY